MKKLWTVDEIRLFTEGLRSAYEELLGGLAHTAADRVRDGVATYMSELLPHVGERLLKCQGLLRRGLRDEAIGYALEEPDLKVVASLLNLRRFGKDVYQDWMDASRAYGIVPLQPVPDMRVLVDAEGEVAEIRPLLDRWRRLNIERAPLCDRISVLRELRGRDATNPVWFETLKQHEEFRLMQIKAALRNGGVGEAMNPQGAEAREQELEAIVNELNSGWQTIDPPENMARHAVSLLANIREHRGDQILDTLSSQLEAAYRDGDKALLKALAPPWYAALVTRGFLKPDDPRLMRAKQAIEYVEALAEYGSQLTELAQSLGERPLGFRARVDWTRHLQKLLEGIEDVAPKLLRADVDAKQVELLADRVDRVDHEIGSEIRFRRVVAALVLVSAFALVGGGAFVWGRLQDYKMQVEVAMTSMEDLTQQLASGVEVTVQGVEKEWSPLVLGNPRIATRLEKLTTASSEQTSRRAVFEAKIEEVVKAIAAVQAADRPDPLEPWPEIFSAATRTLADLQGKSMIVTEAEKARVVRAAAGMESVARSLTSAADDALKGRIKKLESDLKLIEQELAAGLGRAQMLRASASDLKSEAEGSLMAMRQVCAIAACPGSVAPFAGRKLVSSTTASLVDATSEVAANLNKLASRLQTLAGLSGQEDRADKFLAANAFGAYADALRELAKSLARDPVASEYNFVADDVRQWTAIHEWDKFIHSLGDPMKKTADEAKNQLASLNSFNAELATIASISPAVSDIQEFLRLAESRTPMVLAKTHIELLKILNGPYGDAIDGVVWFVPDDADDERQPPGGQKQYYCLRRDRPNGQDFADFDYLTQWKTSAGWTKSKLRFKPAKQRVADAPQKTVALKCLEIVESIPLKLSPGYTLDSGLLAVVQTCAECQQTRQQHLPNFDPMIHALLLRKLLLEARSLSPILEKAFEPSLKQLQFDPEEEDDETFFKGVDDKALIDVLDPELQFGKKFIDDARVKCREFIEGVGRDSKAADATLKALKSRWSTWPPPNPVIAGRLRRSPDGAWSISGGDPAQRAEEQVFVVHKIATGVDIKLVATCDKNGQILRDGLKIMARAGDPVYVLQDNVSEAAKK